MPTFRCFDFNLVDNLDTTKQLFFDAAAITTGTVVTLRSPDHTGTMVLSSNTNGGADRQLLFGTAVGSPGQWRDPLFEDNVLVIAKAADSTAKAVFSATNISTITTRTFTFPDASIVFAGSAAALTSGRVPFATTGGLLTDDADMTFATDTLTVTKADVGTLKATTAVSPNGGGMKHGRVTTGSVAGGSTALVTHTWGTAFADANYTVSAQVQDSTTSSLSLSVVHIESVTAAAVAVRVLNNAVTALTGTLHVIGMHD